MGMKPFDPTTVFLIALLNPVVIIVAIALGRRADQWQKIIVAGFAASLAGSVALWFVTYVGILPAKGIGGEGGAFVGQFIFGMIWAGLAYRFARLPVPADDKSA